MDENRQADYDEGYSRGYEAAIRNLPSELAPDWYGHGDAAYCEGYAEGYAAGERKTQEDE
jgi:hypothetical protein